jgi:hypothetical protein
VRFTVSDTATGSARIYEVGYEMGRSVSRGTDRVVSVDQIASTEHGAGTSYSIPADAFHRTEVASDQLVVTVIYGTMHNNAAGLTVRERSAPDRLVYAREAPGRDVAAEVLTQAHAELAAHG